MILFPIPGTHTAHKWGCLCEIYEAAQLSLFIETHIAADQLFDLKPNCPVHWPMHDGHANWVEHTIREFERMAQFGLPVKGLEPAPLPPEGDVA